MDNVKYCMKQVAWYSYVLFNKEPSQMNFKGLDSIKILIGHTSKEPE